MLSDQVIGRMGILGDNETRFILTKNLKSQNFIKYIDVIYHHNLGLVNNRELGIVWI